MSFIYPVPNNPGRKFSYSSPVYPCEQALSCTSICDFLFNKRSQLHLVTRFYMQHCGGAAFLVKDNLTLYLEDYLHRRSFCLYQNCVFFLIWDFIFHKFNVSVIACIFTFFLITIFPHHIDLYVLLFSNLYHLFFSILVNISCSCCLPFTIHVLGVTLDMISSTKFGPSKTT